MSIRNSYSCQFIHLYLAKNNDDCSYLKHPKSKGLDSCLECDNYPCGDCGMIGLDPTGKVSLTYESLVADVLAWGGDEHG